MIDKRTNNEIVLMLESLTCKVDEGFAGVHARQDKTNGNVKTNSEFRLKAVGVLTLLSVIGIGGVVAIIKSFI